MASVLDDMDTVVDRLEDIAEGWCMAADEAVTTEIKRTLAAIPKDKGTADVQDWRETLASIPD
jgi:hypothetical protein